MLDVKTWLEASGLPVADTAFVDAQDLPFIVFLDTVENGGADMENCIKRHSITVEFYSSCIDEEKESDVEMLFDSAVIPFEKERSWISTEELFMTVYALDDIIEKARRN